MNQCHDLKVHLAPGGWRGAAPLALRTVSHVPRMTMSWLVCRKWRVGVREVYYEHQPRRNDLALGIYLELGLHTREGLGHNIQPP